MSILKNKMIKEAVDPKEAQIDNSLYMIDVDIAIDDEISAQRLLRFATKRNVSIQVYSSEDVQNGAILVGARAEVQRVYKKFWADGFDEDLSMFKEDIKKYRPKVYYEYDITLDIMKVTPKVASEFLQSGCIIRDYNDDAKTARILGPKTRVTELARLYFDKSDFDRDKIQKIKESAQEFYFIHSDNDPYECGEEQGKIMHKHLGGKLIIKPGEGHFNLERSEGYKQFPFILELIEK